MRGVSTRPVERVSRVKVFYAVSDGWRQFVFLSSLRPTDKAQAEGWVTSSVKMCGIILLLLLSWQREDTWQIIFCSLMQAFGFGFPTPPLSSFLIALVFAERAWRDRKMSVCVYVSHERPNIYLNRWVWLLHYISALCQKWGVIPPTTVKYFF